MGKWEPIFWIFGACIAFFFFLLVMEYLKGFRKKKG
jgi:hypothetical protein